VLRRWLCCFIPLSLGLLTTACSNSPYSEQAITPIRLTQNVHDTWQQSYRGFIGFPTPQAFSVCHDMSCHRVSRLSLSATEWQRVTQFFVPAAETPVAERGQIASGVALMEKIVGSKIGTDHDLGRNVMHGSRQGQMDCVDEATNTSVYLRMFDNQGLLTWHQAAPRTARGPLTGQAPHNTASIIDTMSGRRYAVDAWFYANGEPPAIVLLDTWKAGWKPAALR
jgi:hypothetical protein